MFPKSADQRSAVPSPPPGYGVTKEAVASHSSVTEERQDAGADTVDFRLLFESAPGLYLVLEPEHFRIVAASDAYLRATMTEREKIIGKSVFEIFPEAPNEPDALSMRRFRDSLERVKQERRTDVIPVHRYSIRRPESDGGGFEERWWSPVNSPAFSKEGKLIYIIHRVEDVTYFVQRKQEQGKELEAFQQLESRAQHMEAEIELRAGEMEQAKELRESEERFRAAFADAPVGMVLMDPEGRFQYVNKAFCQLTGYSEDELLSEIFTFQRLTHPDDLPRNFDELRHLLKGEIPAFFIEKRYFRKDGTTYWVRASTTVLRDSHGTPLQLVGLVEDIDARKRIEEALRDREHRYHTLLVSIDQGYVLCEIILDQAGRPVDYRFLEVNSAFGKMTGLPVDESVGRTARELIPELEEFWAETYGKVALTGESARFENYSAAMGRWFDVFASSVGGGKFVLLFSDITERKCTEAALQYQHQLIRSITENAPVAIYRIDSENRVLFANPASQRLFGWSEEELLGRSLHDTLHHHYPDGRPYPQEECEFMRSLKSGETKGEAEAVFFRKDGSPIEVSCFYRPLPSAAPAGTDGGAIVVVQDITERKKAERGLQEANQRKDEFLAMLAHELRNPLAAIRNAVNVSQMSRDEEDRQWAEEVMERQIGNLSRIVDDLLDVSRITSGKIQLRKERLDAAAILDHALETVEALLAKRQHQLTTIYQHDGSLLVDADPTRLEQIVVNLLTNAAKYTEPGGRIWLEAKREGDEVIIQVRDTGIGIPPDKLPAMFEIFVQGERTIARSEGGLGIGLSIVRRLVEMHGGTISAQSEGKGKGSTFTVHLPVPADQSSKEKVVGTAGAVPRRGGRILVVDDNEDTARGLSRILKLSGHEVEVCYDGPAALEKARTFHPEFVLLDIGLPEMDGYEVAFRLRREGGCSDSVIVAISGYGQEEDQRRSQQAGFDHHLVKPVNLEDLKALLARYLSGASR